MGGVGKSSEVKTGVYLSVNRGALLEVAHERYPRVIVITPEGGMEDKNEELRNAFLSGAWFLFREIDRKNKK